MIIILAFRSHLHMSSEAKQTFKGKTIRYEARKIGLFLLVKVLMMYSMHIVMHTITSVQFNAVSQTEHNCVPMFWAKK